MAFKTNIEKDTESNTDYRRVLYTGKMQLVVMSLKAGEDIPMEIHPDIDQFIRVEVGNAYVKVGDEEFNLVEDEMVIIPAGQHHYVKNSGEGDLKLYTIYTPAEHAPETVHKTKEEADNHEH